MKPIIAFSGTIAVAFFVGLLAFENASKHQVTQLSQDDQQIVVGLCGNEVAASTQQCFASSTMSCAGQYSTIQKTCANGHTLPYDWRSGCKPLGSTYQTACPDLWGAAFGGSVEHGYYQGPADDCGTFRRASCDTPPTNVWQRCHYNGSPACFEKVYHQGNACEDPSPPNQGCPGTRASVGSGC